MSTLTYDDLKLPVYVNTRPFFANLSVSDAIVAAVPAGLSLLLAGDTGCGKTQAASDIYWHLFGGNIADGGKGILIRAHPEVDIYNEIFTQINVEAGRRELTDNIKALLYRVEELNRAPSVAQNQFYGLGDGDMDHKGKSITLGQDGYHMCLATANLGNGEFSGTFKTDKAMYNRLHVAFDFDYPGYKPTAQDRFEISCRKADPNVQKTPARDISELILAAHQEIRQRTEELGLEATAVLHYLSFGLENCLNFGKKSKSWPRRCQGCERNSSDDTLCSLLKQPVERTLQATALYAAALEYVAKLKNPAESIDAVELMFKAFEMTGAYQSLLNPGVLRQQYEDDVPAMMHKVVEELKKDFLANKRYIFAAIRQVQKGKRLITFFEQDSRLGNYEELSNLARKSRTAIEPFTNQRPIGLGWVKEYIDYLLQK